MKNNPLVSIIVPTYNRGPFIRQTLDSIISQSYKEIELLVIDDGSTDNTLEILGNEYPTIAVYSHPNQGEQRTVNRGLSLAKGDYIVVVSSDDPLLPEHVYQSAKFLETNPHIGVSYPDWQMIDEKGRVMDSIECFDYDFQQMLTWHHCFPGPGTMFRRSLLKLVGGRDARYKYVGDFDFWLRLGLHTQFARIPDTLATWRNHAESQTTMGSVEKMCSEHLQVIEAFFTENALSKDVNRLRSSAFASAYFINALLSASHSNRKMAHYLTKAVMASPSTILSYPGKLQRPIQPLLWQMGKAVLARLPRLFTSQGSLQ